MGKRKRRADLNETPSSSEAMPPSHQTDMLSKQKSSHQAEHNASHPPVSVIDIKDNSTKMSQGHQSPRGSGCGLLLKHPNHCFPRRYHKRSSNHSEASPSNRNEYREKAFHKPDRIRSSSLAMNAVSADVRKMECVICQKPVRKKPFNLGNSMSSSDVSVVAVLVCGHVYHADCLEQKTSYEDRRDPPCPLCVGRLLHDDA